MISRRQNTEVGIVIVLVLLMTGLITSEIVWYKTCVLVLLLSVLCPVVYTPVSWLWFGLARIVERLFSTILLTLVFYLVVTPVALLRRCVAKDTLRLRCFKKQKDSVFLVTDKKYTKEDLDKQF